MLAANTFSARQTGRAAIPLSTRNRTSLFRPESMAVIGASDRTGSVGLLAPGDRALMRATLALHCAGPFDIFAP